jgi:hypothetical protein
MNLSKAQFRACLPWAIFLVILLMVAWDAVFMRFVLYHSQNRNLRPGDYDVQVVTAEDYRSFSDPSQTTVRLSDDSVLTKGVAWDSSRFKPVQDGTMFVKVTTKGTAHILDYTLPKLLLILFFGLVGMIVTWPRACKTDQGSRTTESNAK